MEKATSGGNVTNTFFLKNRVNCVKDTNYLHSLAYAQKNLLFTPAFSVEE